MKLFFIFPILAFISVLASDNTVVKKVNIQDIEKQIDSINTQTHINQELFRVKFIQFKNKK